MRALPITGEYPPDWKAISDATWAAAGHRCIRCGHPYRKGEHGKGEWTPCDDKCNHAGPLAILWPDGRLIEDIAGNDAPAMFRLNHFGDGKTIVAQWRIGTVHHLDGNKANCQWWNLLALCQRCHLTIQSRVNPEQPYYLEHSAWFQPYVAGFYAWKYEHRQVTRIDVTHRIGEMERLLALERIV